MPIKKVTNSTEKYRETAKSLIDTHMLTGRGYNKKVTFNRISYIKKNLSQMKVGAENMVDIGCGDGSFMKNLIKFGSNFIGILPSQEEVEVVQKLLENHDNIYVMKGLSTELPFEDQSKQFLLCNGVLQGVGFNDEQVKKSLYEFYRVLSDDGILYLGEMPEMNEMEGIDYGTSFCKYLKWVLKNRGISEFFNELKRYLKCLFSREIYILQPTNMYFCPKLEFTELLHHIGFKVKKIYVSTNNKKILLEDTSIKRRRLDYICSKNA